MGLSLGSCSGRAVAARACVCSVLSVGAGTGIDDALIREAWGAKGGV